MNQEELFQRQQQIYRLHKRIREYKLTDDEERQLQRNKQQQQTLIEAKFSASKINQDYKFPKNVYDEDSPFLGYKDVCDLTDVNTMDTVKRQTFNYVAQIQSIRSRKSPQQFYTSTEQSVKPENSIFRESYSPGVNRTFDSKASLQKKYEPKLSQYISTNKSQNTQRMTTQSNENKSRKEEPLCQSIKSIIKVKSSLNSVKRKQIFTSKDYLESTMKIPSLKMSTTIKSKNRVLNKGKENEVKPRYPVSKKSYNTNTLQTEHDKSLREWNRSYYNSNTQKSINAMFSSVKSKDRLLTSTSKWINPTEGNEELKSSLGKYQEGKKFVKRKDFKNPYKTSLNQTAALKSIYKNEPKSESYFSKVFQNIRYKNSESHPQSGLHSSCSRIPIGLSSPLSSKYFQYKQNMTLTNR